MKYTKPAIISLTKLMQAHFGVAVVDGGTVELNL